MSTSNATVMVSGCFDLLHAGHVRFFETAAAHGRLVVCVGADANIERLKGHRPHFGEEERRYMVGSLATVAEARIGAGEGMLDFEPDLIEVRPDTFVVNDDGDTDAKRELCDRHGVHYVVLPRTPAEGLPIRSSTQLKDDLLESLPYRLCLAGGWLDQPWVSELHAGPVITCQIAADPRLFPRAGLATSTRKVWARLAVKHELAADPDEVARLLFRYENPPGAVYVSGSQDAIGLTFSGINRLAYHGRHWPESITRIRASETLRWLQAHLVLVPIGPRPRRYDPLVEQHLSPDVVACLAQAATQAWEGIATHDADLLGTGLSGTHDAWRAMLPATTSPQIDAELARLRTFGTGATTTGAGGGFVILVTDREPADIGSDAFRVTIT